ncbi:MAG: glycosyltransferase [Desulfuromonadaceae bacterium]|nr:glycosyltransferase [Desulfuromonadaceae bacterium]MDD5104168.1 glycosyltransferase [Desulfuromonadaceae bacterium]
MNRLFEILRESAYEALANGRSNEAMLLLAKMFLADPANSANYLALSNLCRHYRKWDELDQFSRIRLSYVPNDGEALCGLASVCFHQKRFAKALSYLEQSLPRNPCHVNTLIELSRLHKRFGSIDDSIRFLQDAIFIAPNSSTAHDNLVFTLLFSDKMSPEEIFKAHLARSTDYNRITTCNSQLRAHKKIRIGYVSPDFREHSVASFIEPVIRSHDRSRFEVFCYHTHPEQDEVTDRIKSIPVNWRDISNVEDSEALKLIRNDGIQILVDLAGYTAWNRLALFAIRPAPLQVTWLGYPHSTGMNAIDYRISDFIADPPGLTERFHTEQLLRLPGPFLCFKRYESCPARRFAPSSNNNGSITFASFNNLAKASPTIVGCWIQILQALPNSRLILKAEIFADPEATAMTLERMGLDPNRVVTVASTPDRGSHLAFYNQVDIALDTFPYHGTTTTCEALSMGVPVVTMVGEHHAARVGVSLLTSIGRKELIAETAEEYVKIAIDLANEPDRLNSLHYSLPDELMSSRLTDEKGFTASLEVKYMEIYQNLCDSAQAPIR